MSFPVQRPRRLRRNEGLRGLARETRLSTQGLIYPMFVCPGTNVRTEVSSMPGIYQRSVDKFIEECREVEQLGIPGIILFGLPEKKDEKGSEATASDGPVQRAIEAVRKAKLNLIVMTDICLCEYTSCLLYTSTCNRSELYGVAPIPNSDVQGVMERLLADFHGLAPAELNGRVYRENNTEAVRHLFRVASGLDSMLLGEAEILGQVREAYGRALEHGSTGPVLNRLFQGCLLYTSRCV